MTTTKQSRPVTDVDGRGPSRHPEGPFVEVLGPLGKKWLYRQYRC